MMIISAPLRLVYAPHAAEFPNNAHQLQDSSIHACARQLSSPIIMRLALDRLWVNLGMMLDNCVVESSLKISKNIFLHTIYRLIQ